MDINKLTEKAREAVVTAQSLATPSFTDAQATQGKRRTIAPVSHATVPISTMVSSRRR